MFNNSCPPFLVQSRAVTNTLARPAPLVLDGDALDPIGGGGALVGYGRVST